MMRKIFCLALCALALLACKKTPEEGGELLPNVVTGEVIDMTPVSATITGSARTNAFMDEIQKGVLVSYFQDFTVESSAFMVWSDDDSYDFTVTVTGLEPGTTYYYRSYLYYDTTILGHDKRYYGEIKSFTTPDNEIVVTTNQPVASRSTVYVSGSVSIAYKKFGLTPYAYFIFGKTADDISYKNETARFCIIRSDGTFDFSEGYSIQDRGGFCRAMVEYDGKEYFGEIMSIEPVAFAPTGGEAIDMGLSVKWRACNVGARVPEEYGDYYSWGETTTKENYSDYYYTPPSGNPEVLPLYADAAYVNTGLDWRMPTGKEYDELLSNTLFEFGEYNSVNGVLLISKKNSNTIFFPSAGRILTNNPEYDGVSGFYWSSSISERHQDYYYAFSFSHSGDSGSCNMTNSRDPEIGASVRPVRIN